MGHGLNERRATIATVDFDPCEISVGFDARDFVLDVDFLNQRLDERQ